MNSAALAVVALGSATQVALYLRSFGATHRTDGFIAAFAVYSLVVVLAQILRTTAVPLLSGPAPALTGAAYGWAIAVIAAVAAVACEALAAPLADLVAGASGAAGRTIATASLRVMAPAMGLQIVGAGLAVAGAVRGRLVAVALAYMASSVAGLTAFFLLRGSASERVLAWTMLVASLVLVAGLLLADGVAATTRRPPGASVVGRACLALMRSTPLPACFVLMYPITLALAPGRPPGRITLFGLAFTACSYLAGFTGQALSMVDAVALAQMDAGAVDERRAVVTRAFRYSLLVAVPGLGVAAVAGGPIVDALLPHSSTGSHGYFGADVLLLVPWLVATLGLWALLPAVLADPGRFEGRLVVAAVALVALHIAAELVGRAIAGFDGLIVAVTVAPAAFVAASLRVAVPTAGRELLRNAAVIVAIGAVSFGACSLGARAIADGGALAGVAAAAAGALVYAALATVAFPDAARSVLRLAGQG